MPVVTYLLRRILGLGGVLLTVSVIVFGLMHLVPGGPFDEEKAPLSPAAKANLLRKYGLDRPLGEQYLRYIGGALQGDFGVSFQSPTEPVIGLIGRTWPVSMQLGGLALALAILGGLPCGLVAAVKHNTWIDHSVTFFTTLGLAVPVFVVATGLLWLFAVQLAWLPTGGWPSSGGAWPTVILPVITLALGPWALIARYTRAGLLEVLHMDYIRTARAKGLPERAVRGQALRNALIPLITVLAPQIPNLLTGTIFVESTFRVPGLGKFFVTSITARDYPMIMALMLLVAGLWSVTYLLTDLLYLLIDPRIRLR